jgi:opacity protein-like surface antigen
VDLGYRFAGLGSANTKWEFDEDGDGARFKTKNVYMHQLMLGMRFGF